jgi:4-amino-4-deoxy-L-arabinose transferase-like glycosyltransferase
LVSEPLYIAFMLGAVCAILRWRERGDRALLPAAGVLAGLALLTRTNGIIVALAVLLLAGMSDRSGRGLQRLRPALVVLVCAAVTTAPWLLRNAMVFGRLAPLSTETGETLVGTYNPTARSDRVDPGAWRTLRHIARYRSVRPELAAHPETTADAVLRRDALSYAAAHPAYVLSVTWHNLLRLAELDGVRRTRFGAWTIGLTGGPAIASAFMFYLVALLALAGALLRPAPRAPRALWLLPILQLVSTVVVIGETPRFRVPLEPFILVIAAVAVERLSARVGAAHPSRASVALPGRGGE